MKNLILFIIFFSIHSLKSQNHTQFWFRTSIHHNLDRNWASTLELNHRTQSLANTESPFRYPLTNAMRFWISYKLNSNHIFYLSPYAFFSNDPVVNKIGDEINSNANEHRFHLQYESKIPLNSSCSLNNRLGAEYRIFEGNQDLFRFRIRQGMNYNMSKKMSLQVYDELFLNTININRKHIFDQNRIGLQMSCTFNKHLKFDIGHNLIHALPRNGNSIQTNFMFFTNFNYTI